MNSAIGRFLLRWVVCGVGLWIAALVLSDGINYSSSGAIIISGLILAIINTIIKPFVVILSLPAILFSLGLFMIVINGLMVWLASYLYTPLQVENFGAAILAGVVIGLLNYLVTALLDNRRSDS